MTTERLQKLLAAAGYGSRRACEDYVRAGRVRVNGKVAVIGTKADPITDKITVDGEPIKLDKLIYIALNKPKGVVSSLNAQGERDTVRDIVQIPGRLFPVGRLDIESEGLILLTNDGELTNRLTHPRFGHTKEYIVEVYGNPNPEALKVWRRGVVIKDEEGNSEKTSPADVQLERRAGEITTLRVIMSEGKKHQIRRVAITLGLHVVRLIRVRLGTLQLGSLPSGDWRHLTAAEISALQKPIRPPSTAKGKAPTQYKPQSKSAPDDQTRSRPRPKQAPTTRPQPKSRRR